MSKTTNKVLSEVSKELAEICEMLASRPYKYKPPKKNKCPCCHRMSKKATPAFTKKDYNKQKKEFVKRAEHFKGMAKLFKEV